jgi:hypothetical protein
MTRRLLFALVISATCCTALGAAAATIYDEAVSGDLSGSGLTPTSLSVSAGSNQVFGTTGRDAVTGVDRDYFTISVPSGYQFVSLIELPGTSVVGSLSFLGIQSGSQVTVATNAPDATGLLGWTHFNAAGINTDLLPAIGVPVAGSTGFTPPLGAGAYAFWIQDTGAGSSSYGFDIVIAPVPEPGTAAGVLLGLIALGVARARRLG